MLIASHNLRRPNPVAVREFDKLSSPYQQNNTQFHLYRPANSAALANLIPDKYTLTNWQPAPDPNEYPHNHHTPNSVSP